MNVDDFRASLAAAAPPEGLTVPMRAMWHAGRDEWDRAHELAQSEDTPTAAWVHAHLHRIEGDLANAGYWYRRAKRPASQAALPDEWAEIVAALENGAE